MGLTQSCATRIMATNVWITGIVERLSTINGVSTVNTVHQTDGVAFLGPANPDANLDFQATTYGMRGSCIPISSVCKLGLGMYGAATPYDYKEKYPGVFGDAAIFNVSLVRPPRGFIYSYGTGLNPFHVSISTTVDTIDGTPDVEFVSPIHGDHTILLLVRNRSL